MHSPYYAMMSLEVRAASIRKNRENPRSPATRDLVYEAESPWVGSSGRFLAVRLQFFRNFLLFESAMTSEDIMTASLSIIRGQGILKKQKFVQKLRETSKIGRVFVHV